MTQRHVLWAALSLLVTGCASLAPLAEPVERGIDGVACVGRMATPTDGLIESVNPALVSKARLPTGQGGVCSATVYAVTAPVVIYRVFDSRQPHTQFGGWWSLQRPGNSQGEYRAANAICPEWSQLDRLVSCELRPGSQVVLGTTQSATCADGTLYAKADATQVFVANDGLVGIIHVGNCAEATPWP